MMNRSFFPRIPVAAALACLLLPLSPAVAQDTGSADPTAPSDTSTQGSATAQPAATSVTSIDPLSLQWPRAFSSGNYEFAVYQPQISSWPGNTLEGRFAVAVRTSGSKDESYGVVTFSARTEIDKVNRLVTLADFTISKVSFPTLTALEKQFETMIQAELPTVAETIPLDHLEATFAASADITKVKLQQVKNAPPDIIYATEPSVLVLVDGSPVLKPLVTNYERVVNTRAILLLNTGASPSEYYLSTAGFWYNASTVKGPWTVVTDPPGDIQAAYNAAMATKEVDPAAPATPLKSPPAVYVSTVPTELLETTGPANMLSIENTQLLYIENTSNAIFYDLVDADFYVLISGRWFKATSLYGPWSFVPSKQLPADFQKIPPDSPKSNVLLSVAGTPQAKEAIIASTIPQTATVDPAKATLSIDYVGPPDFQPVEGTSLSYAVNTETPVVKVSDNSYYACQNGVWFDSSSATGPWTVATTVPDEIYAIPPSCPIHYVTYAYVYDATPTDVYVGYTPGYMGVMPSTDDVVVYGTGYTYPPVVAENTYIEPPPTYGSGASLAMGAAVGLAFGYAIGHDDDVYYPPHWGPYGAAYPYHHAYAGYNVNSRSVYTGWGNSVVSGGSRSYDPWTGTSSASQSATKYNSVTGASKTASRGASFNPYSGNESRSRSEAAYNPVTGSSEAAQSAATKNIYNGNYAATRDSSTNNAVTGRSEDSETTVSGNVYNHTESVSSSGEAYDSKTGNSAAWNNGSVTVDKDGNFYTSNGALQNRAGSSYQSQGDREGGGFSWSNNEMRAQATGNQRFNNYRRFGEGGWGGGGFRRR